MNVVFVGICDPHPLFQGFNDAVECARLRAGCPVYALTNRPLEVVGGIDATGLAERAKRILGEIPSGVPRLHRLSLVKWVVSKLFVEENAIKPPWCFPDWDVMITEPLDRSYAPFSGSDMIVPVEAGGNCGPCFIAETPIVLSEFVRAATSRIQNRDYDLLHIHDMLIWGDLIREGKVSYTDFTEPRSGMVFDPNMSHDANGTLQLDGTGYKRVEFRDGHAWFFAQDGSPVLANCFHCWGRYKDLTKWILDQIKGC